MDTRRPLRIITTLLILSALQILSAETGRKIPIAEDLYLKEIGLNVWIHVSAEEVPPWGKISANGLAVLAGNEVMLIDTPWNDRQTGDLALWFESEKGAHISAAGICQYNDDNLGGLGWIRERGIASYSTEKTQNICRKKATGSTASVVVPGQGEEGSLRLIDHTI